MGNPWDPGSPAASLVTATQQGRWGFSPCAPVLTPVAPHSGVRTGAQGKVASRFSLPKEVKAAGTCGPQAVPYRSAPCGRFCGRAAVHSTPATAAAQGMSSVLPEPAQEPGNMPHASGNRTGGILFLSCFSQFRSEAKVPVIAILCLTPCRSPAGTCGTPGPSSHCLCPPPTSLLSGGPFPALSPVSVHWGNCPNRAHFYSSRERKGPRE